MTGRRFRRCFVHLFLLAAYLLSSVAAGHTLNLPGHPQRVRDRPYHVSVDQCGAAMAAEVDAAAAIWNFYSPARLVRVDSQAPPRAQRYLAVTCQDDVYFHEILGRESGLDGSTFWRYTNWQLTSADIIFNTDTYVPGHCSRLHEIGHAVGLGHSDVKTAAMSPDSNCQYLTADDLVGIAEVFDVAPNCTPFVTEDFTVYFPNVAGEQLELRPMIRGSPAAGFYESGHAASIGTGWQCDIARTSDAITGRFLYRGAIYRVTLKRAAGGWELVSARP